MPQLLQLDSSAEMDNSTSRTLTARFAGTWRGLGPDHTVVVRDLHADPLPHLPSPALHWAPRMRTATETATPGAERLQQELIDELTAVDVVVVGAPMYNWAVPSTLKAWIDHVHVPGVTAPTTDGPTQPFAGKPIVVVSSRGNTYAPGTAQEGTDYVEPSLRAVFGTSMGMDVSVVTAELTLADRVAHLAPLAEQGRNSLAAAEHALDHLARTLGTP